MIAAGIDLGGTKIEAQLYAPDWSLAESRRVATPGDYPALLDALADQIAWIDGQAGAPLPLGVAAAGLVNPETGLAFTANLPATDHPLPADIARMAGRAVPYLNDCRALTLSEAVFGAGKGAQTVVGLILGTGIGGGVAVGGHLLPSASATGGEFGHMAAPAAPVVEHGLPVLRCGCGRMGCMETYVAGPGLARLAEHLTGHSATPPEIAAGRNGEFAKVWQVWCGIAAQMLITLTMTVDPEVIVLGGGLSRIEGLTEDLTRAMAAAQLRGFSVPRLAPAQGGDASGGRGAAYAAWQAEAVA